jgi:hypothetical protein
VQREIDALAGKRVGYANVRRLLGVDPCSKQLGAYRLSGPLEPIVCGVHLERGYRLAFTTQPPLAPAQDSRLRVVILYVGKREPGHRTADVWDLLHDLFEVDNPPAGHQKPPCCADDLPRIEDDQLREFIANVRRLHRKR